jgi:hypothetical protein
MSPSRRQYHAAALEALLGQLAEELSRPVGRTVINDQDFFLDLDGLDPRENLLDGRPLVVDRHDDRELQRAAFRLMSPRRRREVFLRLIVDQRCHRFLTARKETLSELT